MTAAARTLQRQKTNVPAHTCKHRTVVGEVVERGSRQTANAHRKSERAYKTELLWLARKEIARRIDHNEDQLYYYLTTVCMLSRPLAAIYGHCK